MNTMTKHTIKNKLEIFNLLKNIQKSRQIISVSFDSLPHHCITLLLDIHHGAKILVFDETNPKISQKLIENKSHAEFSLKLDNLPIKFKSKLISNNYKPDHLYAHFPEEMYYPQNRNSFRYKTEFLNGANASIQLKPGKQLDCTLVNISVHGLCLRFAHKDAPLFLISNLIKDIHIKLPHTNDFTIAAKVQFKRYETSNANMTLGLHIHEQHPSIEKTIQQFIFSA